MVAEAGISLLARGRLGFAKESIPSKVLSTCSHCISGVHMHTLNLYVHRVIILFVDLQLACEKVRPEDSGIRIK